MTEHESTNQVQGLLLGQLLAQMFCQQSLMVGDSYGVCLCHPE